MLCQSLLYSKVTQLCFVVVQSLSRARLFVTPWTVAHQAPLSMGFSRQEYWRVKASYMAQNSLVLKLPSRSSPPFYAKERTLSPKVKNGHQGWLWPAPSRSSLWPISRIPCPSHLRDNYSEQPWRRTGPLKTVAFHIRAYIYLLFSWVSAAAH